VKNYPSLKKHLNAGFTLVELLVVIFILGVLTSLIVSNLQSARQRARDAKIKSGARDLKTALRLYYNDFQKYPEQGNGTNLPACGPDGTSVCPYGSCDADFAAGGTSGCETVYMQKLPEDFSYRYYSDGQDKFCFKVFLENLSDSDLQLSEETCGGICSSLGSALNTDIGQYAVCNQ
jgi:prepilin-type N-terminal cleavage/methylation domain-containing protein